MKTLTDKEKAQRFDKFQESHKKSSLRQRAKRNIILRKAEQAGIVATEEEIAIELKRLNK